MKKINTKKGTDIQSVVEQKNTQHKGDIFDLANCFLAIDSMTNNKLQILCYYAKAWYLAIYNQNLIIEQFEAGIHGAVQPLLNDKYSSYGFQLIPKYELNVSNIPKLFLDFAREVFFSYGEFTGYELEIINRNEAPWIKARGELKSWECGHNIIREESMKSYYASLINNE